jgi:hypothetical protein
MKRLILLSLSALFTAFTAALFAQTELAIGQWKAHLPFRNGQYVTQSDNKVWYATPQALLEIDKTDLALRRITKVEELSQVGVKLVKYNPGSGILAVVYNDGVIDLLDNEQGARTLRNIKVSNIVLGEKSVSDIFMVNDSIAHLSANFGFTTLNLRRGLFPTTVRTPVPVNSVQVFRNQYFISTQEGIYSANPAAGYNIDDFSNWEYLDENAGFPGVYKAGKMVVFNDKLYASINDSLFVYDGNQASFVHFMEGKTILFLTAEGSHLVSGWGCESGCGGSVLIFNADHSYSQAPGSCVDFPLYAIEAPNGELWYADLAPEFRHSPSGSLDCQRIGVNSPYSANVSDIATKDGQVWVAAGGLSQSFIPLTYKDGFFSLINGTWSAYSHWVEPILNNKEDFYDLKIHPENGKIYTGSINGGLVVYDPVAKTYEIFDKTNSTLQPGAEDSNRTRTAGLAFDQENNLWICNSLASKPLSVFRNDVTWEAFDLACTSDNGILEITIDQFGYKWMTFMNASIGVAVFDEGDPTKSSDDRCKIINKSNSALPTNEVLSLEVDLDGAVWVGTKEGALVFQCDPFGECPGSRPFVTVDGFGANLLEDQSVITIGIDGANRKWFGTGTGIFVMSPDGNEQIAKFTTENSPLFDNTIYALAFNDETGEVYIGTGAGIQTYRSDATKGGETHRSDVLVFPNPVRPEYDGPIAIKGLAQDATVKITDVNGQLVFETEALGGQAIWNGRDYNGRKASTGVYLVFATSRNSSNPDVEVTRILVVN